MNQVSAPINQVSVPTNKSSAPLNQRHTVKVNDGSGVLIQPMSPDYAYVLTAKHCIQEDKDDPNSDIKNNHTVFSFDGTKITVLKVLYHETKDIAILIVEPQSNKELMISCDPLGVNDQVWLCGFPDDRRGNNGDEYSSLIFNYEKVVGDRLILAPDTNGIVASNIVGFSGGGLFTLGEQGKAILLCAIETKMEGIEGYEYHGKISAIPINDYEQFIADPYRQYLGKALAPLLPLHLSSFKHLLEFSFNVAGNWINSDGLSLVLDCLRSVATERVISVNLAPYEVLTKFRALLKVYGRPEHELQSRGLWSSLLELLIISILIDKPAIVDLAYVEKILHSRRLIYIGDKGTWLQYLKDILLSELKDLNENSTIVVKTLKDFHEPYTSKEFLEKAWSKNNISSIPKDRRSILDVNRKKARINQLVDLGALHTKCIATKELEYEDYTNIDEFTNTKQAELLSQLAQEYGTYLTVKDVTDEK